MSLNLNSNRGITQKEIATIMDQKSELKKGTISTKKAFKNTSTDVDFKTQWGSAFDNSPTFSQEIGSNELTKYSERN
jgi:hypothetical protein